MTSQSVGAATRQLTALGLKVTTVKQQADGQTPGTVINQDPAAGTQVEKGDTVTLTVVSAPPGQVQVPNLKGKTVQVAQQQLSGLGLQLQVIFGTGDPNAKIRNQTPSAGSYVDPNSTINVFAR